MVRKQAAMSKPTESKVESLDMKTAISEKEHVKATGPRNGQGTVCLGPTFTTEDANHVYRKLDWNLMPLIFVSYSLSVLDRSNLGNAKIAGMEDDIDLSGRRYDWLATAFYIAYILSQWTTIGWKAFAPHRWAAITVFLWGFISTIQSACTNWAGLMTCCVLLGIIEAMYGPGVPLYLSYFYPREKLGLRIGISYQALRVPSCLLSIVAWFCLPDSPRTARFLSEREQDIAVALSLRQSGDRETHSLQLKQVLESLFDYTSYPPASMYFGCNVCFASLPLFVPTIISQMGAFTTIQSNGLSAPPYILSWLAIVACAFLPDRVNLRGPFIVCGALIAAVGYIVLATQTTVAARYFGLFLATQVFVSVALILTWVGNTHATDSKRAGAFAILATGGQCGPILGTNIFPDSDKPYYRKGMWISCGACLVVVIMGCCQMVLLWRANRRLDRESQRTGGDLNVNQSDMEYGTDKQFRYIL
ncbi:MFS general substrate transporter [Aspergillus ibericus CBS 121593]|uniref:MFS general substrate transporter n=1 Tax=Aspergillus ibericus CBS 121593 TaxID=1448316 RepID=A0A395HBH9_9EURO|nr:MFS general substrate transporter [Aspergillus ibericus CBS 121593]RAL05050.1 MFS general substrate transporter [Aspergillus ibericus CBS 121593]